MHAMRAYVTSWGGGGGFSAQVWTLMLTLVFTSTVKIFASSDKISAKLFLYLNCHDISVLCMRKKCALRGL